MSSAVRRAAMIPARRATDSTSPLPRAPRASEDRSTRRNVSRVILTTAEAVAARAVSGFAAAPPPGRRRATAAASLSLDGDALGEVAGLVDVVPLGNRDRVAHELQRQHRQERS